MDDLPVDLPVSWTPTNRADAFPQRGIALCLSGGGYRAMLFHLGALWRLNEAGYLPRLDRISSVSGGSITAGVLAAQWHQLRFDAAGVSPVFAEAVAAPLRRLARHTIDVAAGVSGIFGPGSAADRVAAAYAKRLFQQRTLQDLPDHPRFVINATNVQSGVLWRFMKPYMRDYRVGEVVRPTVPLAVAVAASSAFPPFLSPLTLRLRPDQFTPATGTDLQRPPYTTRVVLTDGGVYDNLGLETAWKRYDTILVSDGGGRTGTVESPRRDWGRHAYRVLGIVDNQVRALRKRQLIESFELRTRLEAAGDRNSLAYRRSSRGGAYWGIRSDIQTFPGADRLDCPYEKTLVIADTPTRLKCLYARDQERLINWGYAICDAALRAHVDKSLPRGVFPYARGVD